MHCHQVDKAYGILRLVYGAADENLAVSSFDKRCRTAESRLSCGRNEIKVIAVEEVCRDENKATFGF